MLWILLFSVFLGLSCGQQKVFELAGDNPESEDGVLLKMEGQKPSHHHPKARGVVLQAKFSAQTPLIIAPYPLHDNPHYLSLDASFSNKAPSMRQDLSAIGIEPALAQAELEAAQFPDPFANALQTPPPPGSVALDPQKGFRLTGTDDFTRMKPLQLPGQSPGDPSIFVPESEQQMMVPPPPEPVMDSPAPAPREYLGGYEIPMDQHGMPVLNLPCDQYLMALTRVTVVQLTLREPYRFALMTQEVLALLIKISYVIGCWKVLIRKLTCVREEFICD
ncbi:unnamed protein product [Notodromas monacha]|uniref:Ameloblastin n=1 Tax=Notodromas monacha TaxID=399045 RepID=A0A7R9BG49_9CRUS|nr:unnamed protein product [Notodromas monacha]CAG0914834.1 unnamed protein product [Notodromas monacha]